jgi:hypothetical protein
MNRYTAVMVRAVPVWFVLALPLAQASNTDTQDRAAKKACLVGDVEKGVDILADLYVSTNNPTYLYNQGRCYEQNGKNDLAILRFKEYLRKANGLPAADEAAVRKKIDELGATSAGTPNGQTSAPAAQPASSPTAPLALSSPPPVAPEAVPTVDLSRAASTEPSESTPVYKRWWLWTSVGVAVAGGVVTAILLSRSSAPKSPGCSNELACVP